MPKFIEQIIIGLAGFLLTVFLPKHFVTLIRELIKFIFVSLIKYWYLTISISGLIAFANFKTNYLFLGHFTSYKFILIVIFSVIIIVSIIALLRELLKVYSPINIAIYGCFSVKENEYLTIDIDSESLNEKIESVTDEITSSFYSYRNKFIKTNNIILPKFIPIFLGNSGLNKFLRKRVAKTKHLATLHFIRDVNKQNILAIINYDKANLSNLDPISNAERLINNLSSDNDLNCSKIIELTVKVYLLLFGQSLTDLMLDAKKYKDIRYILDDTEKLITSIRTDAENLSISHKSSVDNFLNFWTGYVERYKAILLLEQKQFSGAVQHIIKSTILNPYFPYDNYISLKYDFTKKYGIALTPAVNKTSKELEIQIDDKANDNVKDELLKQVQYAETSFNYEIIKNILQNDNSDQIVELLLSEFEKLDKNNPFILLTISEVIKYVKKGTEKFNEIYVERFDESIELLREILKLDSDFPLVNTKLGLMITFKGMHLENEQLIEEGIKEYAKGMHFMSELGFETNEKSPNR